jgi:hypothetical protein
MFLMEERRRKEGRHPWRCWVVLVLWFEDMDTDRRRGE